MTSSSLPDRLEMGMFDNLGRSAGEPSRRFGLREGQIEYFGRVIKDAGWYNAAGMKLGYGDLNSAQIARIARELQANEMFVVLNSQDSFWNHVATPGVIGSLTLSRAEKEIMDNLSGHTQLFGEKDEFGEKMPGTAYVANRGEFAIVRDSLVFCGNNRARFYQEGLAEIPRFLTSVLDWNSSVAHQHGEEIAAKHKATYWPGDDIEQYAQQLPREVLDRPDFFSRVLRFALDHP